MGYGEYGGIRRGILSDITADLDSYVLFPNFQNLPTGSAVASSVGAKSTDLAASPTQVLNIPGYGNWTNNGWNLRIHGNVYKEPTISNATVDKLANFYLIDTSVADL